MSKELIALIGVVAGALITGVLKWLTSSSQNKNENNMKFRTDIINRVNQLEHRQTELEREVTTWKIRYWSLYAKVLKEYSTEPPDFHTMGLEELEKGYNHAKKKMKDNIKPK